MPDSEWSSIPHAVLSLASQRPGDDPALIDDTGFVCHGQLADLVYRAAAALADLGVRPGDRVAILAPNSSRWVVAALGAQLAGTTLVPLNTRLRIDDLSKILSLARPRVLCVASSFKGTDYRRLVREAVKVSGSPSPDVVLLDDDTKGLERSLATLMAGADPADVDAARGRVAVDLREVVADALFTSGTTGHPKGVLATHQQSLRAFTDYAERIGLGTGDRYAIVAPFAHTMGYKAGWLTCLLAGATAVILPTADPDQLATAVATHQVTYAAGPPAVIHDLLESEAARPGRLGSLRVIMTGATDVPPRLLWDLRDRLGVRVVTGYGLTESTGVATLTAPSEDDAVLNGSVGKAMPDVQVICVDREGKRCRPDQAGEILVRGYNVVQQLVGPHGEEAVAVDDDGWLHTGDIGAIDIRGHLRIVGRVKDLIIVGGFNVFPAEVEAVLDGHPAVDHLSVVGVPHERLGEIPVAFVVPNDPKSFDPDGLTGWARERLANYKVPRHVWALSELPRTPSGKVQRTELRLRAVQRLTSAQGPEAMRDRS